MYMYAVKIVAKMAQSTELAYISVTVRETVFAGRYKERWVSN